MSFLLGVLTGIVGTFVAAALYIVYRVYATRYLLVKMKNDLQREFIEARRQVLDDTIKQLEDHANDED